MRKKLAMNSVIPRPVMYLWKGVCCLPLFIGMFLEAMGIVLQIVALFASGDTAQAKKEFKLRIRFK